MDASSSRRDRTPPARWRSVLERAFAGAAQRLERPLAAILSAPAVRNVIHRRAVRAWRAHGTPLIVCYGNINRSAFAAALARSRSHPGARSGGFHPQEGRPVPHETVVVAKQLGVDLASHRSRCVTGDELAGAPAVFVFDLENLARIAARSPRALAHTHLLGALDDDPRLLIADPYARGPEVLRETLSRIARAVDAAGG